MPATRTLLCSLAAVAALAACGGGSGAPPDPLQKYREQTVQWTACDPGLFGPYGTGKLEEVFAQYGERLRCAMVRAPLDWQHPERGEVLISTTRLAAGQPAKRRGALLFNPGGPGGDGALSGALRLTEAFAQSEPASPLGALQLRLLAEYDLVDFSPRGVGRSAPLLCASNEMQRPVDLRAEAWDARDNTANAAYNDRRTAEACLASPVAPYIHTDATARDMDLLRGLLGEDQLHYVGYSYGTWLGAWYASLFPERVGRMVLDSAMDFSARFEEASIAQVSARQRMFDKVIAPYAARHDGTFHLGTTEAEANPNLVQTQYW